MLVLIQSDVLRRSKALYNPQAPGDPKFAHRSERSWPVPGVKVRREQAKLPLLRSGWLPELQKQPHSHMHAAI